jgi:hypothetical protein
VREDVDVQRGAEPDGVQHRAGDTDVEPVEQQHQQGGDTAGDPDREGRDPDPRVVGEHRRPEQRRRVVGVVADEVLLGEAP